MTLPIFDLATATAALFRDGASDVTTTTGPPRRVDGFVVGMPILTRNPPHNGEMHPDGDELLYLLSGSVEVCYEDAGAEHSFPLQPGEACIVPKGIWHKVRLLETPANCCTSPPDPAAITVLFESIGEL